MFQVTQEHSDRIQAMIDANVSIGYIKAWFPYHGSPSDVASIEAIDRFNAMRNAYYKALDEEYLRLCQNVDFMQLEEEESAYEALEYELD